MIRFVQEKVLGFIHKTSFGLINSHEVLFPDGQREVEVEDVPTTKAGLLPGFLGVIKYYTILMFGAFHFDPSCIFLHTLPVPGAGSLPKAAPAVAAIVPPVAKSVPMGPPGLSEGAVYKRLNRVVNTPVQGKFRVGDDIREQWKDLAGGRKQLMNIFADCNYDPDRVV